MARRFPEKILFADVSLFDFAVDRYRRLLLHVYHQLNVRSRSRYFHNLHPSSHLPNSFDSNDSIPLDRSTDGRHRDWFIGVLVGGEV